MVKCSKWEHESIGKWLPNNCTKNQRYCVNLKGAPTTKFIHKRTRAYASKKCTANKHTNHKSLEKWIPIKAQFFGNRYNRTIHYSAFRQPNILPKKMKCMNWIIRAIIFFLKNNNKLLALLFEENRLLWVFLFDLDSIVSFSLNWNMFILKAYSELLYLTYF